jgi:histidinol-phosphatase
MSGPPSLEGFVRATPGSAAISDAELRAALEVAGRACDRAREEILPRFRRVAIETKSDGSPVTEADRAAELAIRAVIEESFPEDAILGEEFGAKRSTSRRRWVIDPIDGTIAFSRGIPLFTTLVALLVDDEPVLGMIDLPAVNDRISGHRGGGVWRETTRLQVSKAEKLEDALICHGDLFCFERSGLRPLYDALSRNVRTLRGYTDAFGHLLVLSGAAEGMVDCDLNPWDAAVTRVLAPEAGGVCWVRERESGQKLDLVFGNESIVESIGQLARAQAHRTRPRG